MMAEGADILDLGGQSTRPGHTPISAEAEWARLAPVLEQLVGQTEAVLSVDTYHPEVAKRALQAGAHIINDVSGKVDPQMAQAVAQYGAGWVLMHATPLAETDDALAGVQGFFAKAHAEAVALGVAPAQLCFDPGIGFGKSNPQCWQLIRQTRQLKQPKVAYLLGASRKRCIGAPAGNPPAPCRDPGTLAAHTIGLMGGADILRVHDVVGAVQAAKVADAICRRAE